MLRRVDEAGVDRTPSHHVRLQRPPRNRFAFQGSLSTVRGDPRGSPANPAGTRTIDPGLRPPGSHPPPRSIPTNGQLGDPRSATPGTPRDAPDGLCSVTAQSPFSRPTDEITGPPRS